MTLDNLMRVLNDEKNIYADMLRLSETKKDAITHGDVGKLDCVVKAERLLLAAITENESKRRQAMKEFAQALGMDESRISLSAILDRVSDEEKRTIETFQAEFKGILDKQTELNETNRSLISTQLEYIRFSVDAIRQTKPDSNNYSAAGLQTGTQTARLGVFEAEV